jgi:biopolymer transport protein ExbD
MKATTGPLYERIIHMRRVFRKENRIANGLIDSAPFIDVVLLFFLFFHAGHLIVLQPGMTIDLPEAPFVSGADYQALILFVTQEGHFYVGDERTTLTGLDYHFARAVHGNPDARLLIEADRRVEYATLVDIYNKAMGAGIRRVVLGTRISSPQEGAR